MGQKINPNAIRLAGKAGRQRGVFPGSFSNHWFSDYKYSYLFFQDFFIRRIHSLLMMKYYKTRIRFLKGRRRRLKSLLRFCRFFSLRFSYKMVLLSCFLRPAVVGLQRKHTAFVYKISNRLSKSPSVFVNKKNSKKRVDTYRLKNEDVWSNSATLGSLKRFKKLATLQWHSSL